MAPNDSILEQPSLRGNTDEIQEVCGRDIFSKDMENEMVPNVSILEQAILRGC